MYRTSTGFSMVEMLAVVSIIALLAFMALPSAKPSEATRVDQAANEVAQAIRFSRSEAMRTGETHGVLVDTATQRVAVYLLDESINPPVPLFTVRNPSDKKLYDLRFGSDPILSTASIGVADITFAGLGPANLLSFSAQGTPHFTDGNQPYMLSNGAIELVLGNHRRTVSVTPYNGRTSVQ